VAIPLKEGKVSLLELSGTLERLCVLRFDLAGEIDLQPLQGSRFVAGINKALGAGLQIDVDEDVAVLQYDTEHLPQSPDAFRAAARVFTAVVAPEATAAQNRTVGLMLPKKFDPTRRLVLLVHGLDSDRTKWFSMAGLLAEAGYQVGWFSYPSDQPIADSAALFAKHFGAMRQMFPDTRVDVLAHSMGSLVTRGYIEGDAYAGGVDHLILVGPPNHGSRWARYRFALELKEHFDLWRNEPDWSPTWMITDGLGEAGRDLKPRSEFIAQLNARPRRQGVRYTIIAGDRHPAARITGNTVTSVARIVPTRVAGWWGFRQTVGGINALGRAIKDRPSSGDGPVSIRSTRLDGVEDRVVLHADHNALFQPIDSEVPAAWEVIRDRLER
jgi:pimeloyl-ACP methyl ester carboxylesterase